MINQFPRTIAEFEVVKPIGSGGMGMVFEAVDPTTATTVAIKLLDTQTANVGERAKRFAREVAILASLDHPNIVGVISSGTSDGEAPYFVMEFVAGGTLREQLKLGSVSPERVVEIVQQIADALDYLHENAVVHRDLKPENILLLADGTIKLTDFGISAREDVALTQLTTTGQVLGTFEYMSPEQRHRLPTDHRSDIYSLGVVTYEMLTGRRPAGRFRAASHWNSDIPDEVDDVLNRALLEEPLERQPTAGDFVRELRRGFKLPQLKTRTKILSLAAVILTMSAALPVLSDALLSRKGEKQTAPDAADPVAQSANGGLGPGGLGGPNQGSQNGTGSGAPSLVDETRRKLQLLEFNHLAEEAADRGNWEAVIENYSQFIKLDPTTDYAYLRRAHAYYSLRNKTDAIADAKKVLEINPKSADAPTLLARIYLDLGDLTQAEAHALRALSLSPKNPEALLYLGRTFKKRKEYDSAIARFTELIDLQVDMPGEVYNDRALCYIAKKDYSAGNADFAAWTAFEPDNPFAWSMRGNFLVLAPKTSGFYDAKKALEFCMHGYKLRQTEGIVLRNLSVAYAHNRKIDEAIKYAELAVQHSTPAKKHRAVSNLEQMKRLKEIAEKAKKRKAKKKVRVSTKPESDQVQ